MTKINGSQLLAKSSGILTSMALQTFVILKCTRECFIFVYFCRWYNFECGCGSRNSLQSESKLDHIHWRLSHFSTFNCCSCSDRNQWAVHTKFCTHFQQSRTRSECYPGMHYFPLKLPFHLLPNLVKISPFNKTFSGFIFRSNSIRDPKMKAFRFSKSSAAINPKSNLLLYSCNGSLNW